MLQSVKISSIFNTIRYAKSCLPVSFLPRRGCCKRSCNDSRESPMNLIKGKAQCVTCGEYDPTMFEFWEKRPQCAILENTGSLIKLTFEWCGKPPRLTGGLVDCTYVLEKVEYFWGSHDCQGSEHQIGSKSYPFERQVVFYRSDLECYEEACGVPDGILRLCAVFNIDTLSRRFIPLPMTDYLSFVAAPCSTFSIDYTRNFTPTIMIGFLHDHFYKYAGDNTIWLMAERPLTMTIEQLDSFRRVCGPDGLLVDNNRPLRNNPCAKLYFYEMQLMKKVPDCCDYKHWSYTEHTDGYGPDEWLFHTYPQCNLNCQKPHFLPMNKAIKCDAPCRLQICGHFVIPKRVFAINNGHVVSHIFEWEEATPKLTGGIVTGDFQLHSIHYHLGGHIKGCGSEHIIGTECDSTHYPGEVHMVFIWNRSEEKIASEYAIVCSMIEVDNCFPLNDQWRELCQIKKYETSAEVCEPLTINYRICDFIGYSNDYVYAIYQGGDACSVPTHWFVLTQPIVKMHPKHVSAFCHLERYEGKQNYTKHRPIRDFEKEGVRYFENSDFDIIIAPGFLDKPADL